MVETMKKSGDMDKEDLCFVTEVLF